MRKALFAIILVGAAFAGGAAMNGPGLERVKAAIRARLQPPEPPADVAAGPRGPAREVPAAPLPPLVPEGRATPTAVAIAPHRRDPDDPPGRRDEPDRPGGPAIALSPPPPRSEASPLDLLAPEPPASTAAALSSSPSPAEPSPTDPAVAAAASRIEPPARDWADLRRRMRALGVSRYEVEGEPSGRCRFRCVIPLAGRRAVAQQFEGEGDDDFQAAEAALRRVALWRATEMAPP